jgi:hypothetical protein
MDQGLKLLAEQQARGGPTTYSTGGPKLLGPKIAVVPLDGAAQPQARLLDLQFPAGVYRSDSKTSPRFTSDGKSLIYPMSQNTVDNVRLLPLNGGPWRQITNFKSDRIEDLRRSPDGKQIGVLSERVESDIVLLREAKRETE